jgi:hypothetical protein
LLQSAAKNPRKKTSQQVSKSAQITGDNPAENIQKSMKSGAIGDRRERQWHIWLAGMRTPLLICTPHTSQIRYIRKPSVA